MTTRVFPANAVGTATARTSAAAASVPAVSKLPQKLPVGAFIKAGLETLGYGYDTSKRQLSTVRVLHTAKDNIEIVDSGFSSKAVVNQEGQDTLEVEIKENIKIKLDLPSNPTLHFSLLFRRSQHPNLLGTVTKIYLCSARYGYVHVPPVIQRVDNDIDSYRGSGHLYAGYIVKFLVFGEAGTARLSKDVGLQLLQDVLKEDGNEPDAKDLFPSRQIYKLIIVGHGFGGFKFPADVFPTDLGKFPNDVDYIGPFMEAMNYTHQHFLDSLPTFTNPVHHFDPVHDTVPLACLSKLNSDRPQSPGGSTVISSLVFYEEFVREMWKLFPVDYQQTFDAVLGKHSLPELLWKIHTIFPDTLAEIDRFKLGANVCKTSMVYGNEGVGKSLLIGVLLGAGLKLTEKHKFEFDPSSLCGRLPVVGHLDAQTTGASIYSNSAYAYIDTQGLGKTGGKGANLCGAPAIHAMVRVCQPQHVMLVMGPGVFENKAKEFFKQMKILERVVDVRRGLSGVLIVINSQTIQTTHSGEPWSETNVALQIRNAIDTLLSKLSKRFPNFRNIVSFENAGAENEESQQPKGKQTVEEFSAQIEFLEQILKEKNFIYTDLADHKAFIEKVRVWQEKSSKLPLFYFHMDRLAGELGFTTFEQVMTLVVDYYLRLYQASDRINKNEFDIRSILKGIEKQIGLLSNIEKTKNDLSQKKQELERELANEKYPKEQRNAAIRKNIKKARGKIAHWQSRQDLKVLRQIPPSSAPIPRSIWAYLNSWAHTYVFPLPELAPPFCGFELRTVPGTYYSVTLDKGKEMEHPISSSNRYDTLERLTGIEALRFRPKHYNYEDDRLAMISLLCQTKDHPRTEIEHIQPLKEEIIRWEYEERQNKSEIAELEKEIQTLTVAIQSHEQRLEQCQKLRAEKPSLEAQLRQEEKRSQDVQALWQKYAPFRHLMKRIIYTFYQYSPQSVAMKHSQAAQFLSLI